MTVKKICFVGCTKHKKSYKCKASELYSESVNFRKQINIISKIYKCEYYILSAKHGLVNPSDILEPYDLSLYNMNTKEIEKWVENVKNQMNDVFDCKNIHAIFLCGEKYRKNLLDIFYSYEEPFKGLGIGQQMQKMNEMLKEEKYINKLVNE